MSGEAERARAVRIEDALMLEAELHELLVARLDEAMSNHGSNGTTGECECGYVEPHGLGIGMHQLEAAAGEVLVLLRECRLR